MTDRQHDDVGGDLASVDVSRPASLPRSVRNPVALVSNR